MYTELNIDCMPAQAKVGRTIYDIVIKYEPNVVLNFGIAKGYSVLAIAQALRDIGKGIVYAYDIEFIPNEIDNLSHVLMCDEHICIGYHNYYEWLKHPSKFDMLYVDINNDAETYLKTYTQFRTQIANGTPILMEGGNLEREEFLKGSRSSITAIRDQAPYAMLTNTSPYCISILK